MQFAWGCRYGSPVFPPGTEMNVSGFLVWFEDESPRNRKEESYATDGIARNEGH